MTAIYNNEGRELIIFGMKGESQEIYECNNDKIIASLSGHLNISQAEAIQKLVDSDADNPVTLYDEVFWAEVKNGDN